MPNFPLPSNSSREAYVWLQDLKRAKAECATGQRSKLTVADIVERANGELGISCAIRPRRTGKEEGV